MTVSDETEETPAVDAARPRRRRASLASGQIDISAALEAPVRVKHDGTSTPIDPYEAMLRQHVKKAVVNQELTSIKLVLEEAEKHALIAKRQPPLTGGVLVVPKGLPAEVEQAVFDDADYTEQRPTTIFAIMLAVYEAFGMDRLVRCFRGDRE